MNNLKNNEDDMILVSLTFINYIFIFSYHE